MPCSGCPQLPAWTFLPDTADITHHYLVIGLSHQMAGNLRTIITKSTAGAIAKHSLWVIPLIFQQLNEVELLYYVHFQKKRPGRTHLT